jgi:DNA-binding MarR family transcriptional regulator
MRDGRPGDVRDLDDVRALASLAHPDRARLVDALTVDGPSTTSALARRLGLATGSVSHHLTVLVDAGLVQRSDPGTDRRRSSWRLVSRGLRWSSGDRADRPASALAARAADLALFQRDSERAREFIATAQAPWADAAFAGHFWLRLSPAELVELGSQLEDLLLGWRRREIPDDGAERTVVLAFARAFPAQP